MWQVSARAALILMAAATTNALRLPSILRFRGRNMDANGRVVRLLRGNIAEWRADAIATSANPYLEGTKRATHWKFAGRVNVDAAVRTAGGAELEAAIASAAVQQCLPIGVSSALVTGSGGLLRSQWVVHGVAPVAQDYAEAQAQGLAVLQATFSAAIQGAAEAGATSLALPAYGTGVAGFSAEAAAQCAFAAAEAWLEDSKPSPLRRVDLVVWADNVWACWAACARDGRALGRASPLADDFGYTWTAGNCHDEGKKDARAEAQAALFGGGDFLPGFGSLDVL